MTRVRVYDLQGKPQGRISLPSVFETAIRPDVIKKVVLAQQSHGFQPQGRNMMAGKRTTAISIGTGYGIARIPRVKGSRYPKARAGAFAPSTVGGRTTHPPRSEKRISKRVNKKERRLAIRSAIAATADKDVVASRGHVIGKAPTLPLVVDDQVQEISKTKDAKILFKNLGILPDLVRVESSLKIRAGKGTRRGRRRRHGVGPLFVVEADKGIRKAVGNLLGVDVVEVERINAELLAPGTVPGRLTIWTASAIRKLRKLYA